MSVGTATFASLGLSERCRTILCMIGGPYVVCDGRRLDVPEGSKRLLVFVALHGRWVDRRQAAGALWPNGDDERAMGNLRSALWRLRRAGIDVLVADMSALSLREEIDVDVTRLFEWAGRLIGGSVQQSDLHVSPVSLEAVDLLPGWYDDWVIFERERLRQRLLHGLEALSRHLILRERWSEAVEAAMTAVNMEPLRESAQYALAEAHVAEGNLVEARRSFLMYRTLLLDELGVEPSQSLTSLVQYGCAMASGPAVWKQEGANGATVPPGMP
jgi:DNA-binding SARP family transcriptional activator